MNENGYDAASLVCLPRHEYARLVAAKAKMDAFIAFTKAAA